MNQQISDILDRAAELIETKGLAKGAHALKRGELAMFDDLDACYDILGAIELASLSNEGNISHHSRVFFAKFLGFNGYYEIVYWGDNPLRTKEEVVETLKAAAEFARKEAHD